MVKMYKKAKKWEWYVKEGVAMKLGVSAIW